MVKTSARFKLFAAAVIGCFLAGVALFTLLVQPAQAAVGINKQVNFQGKVVNSNGTNVADASYTFKFRIYSASTGDTADPCASTCIWEESKSIATVNGIFQTNLGDTTTLPGSVDFNSDNLYLSVKFNADTEMSPRIRLTAVPYAFNADKLDGLDAASFVQLTPASPQSGTIDVTGNIKSGGILQGNTVDAASAGALTIGNTTATSISLGKTASNITTTVNGLALFKPTTGNDSATAFRVQNAAGVTIFNIDSTNGNISLGTGANRTINVAASAAGAGANLILAGGAAGSGNTNGGDVAITGGNGFGSGVKGVVLIDTPAFATATDSTCGSNCTLTQGLVDSKSAIIANATTTGLTITMPDPTLTTAGRIIYLTGANGSNDFTLAINSGGTLISIAMRQNSTATLIWNGSDWTAAGASSSTTLQSAYDNTLTSAGGAEILLNNTASSNGLTIRNNMTSPILGSVFEVQSAIGTNLLAVNNNAIEYVTNGGAETSSSFATDWTAVGAPTISRNTNLTHVATGQASAQVTTTAVANTGVRNNLTANLAVSTTYQVSFTGKLSSGTFSTLQVLYSRDGGTATALCGTYSTQTLTTAGWSKVTCTFTTDATTATNPDLIIRQTDATIRTFYIDNLSVTLSTSSSTPPAVQIGGGIYGGSVTLLTLDRSSSAPVANGNDVFYGSMYYDTTSGRIQCYEADGWGACGSAPDNFVNLVPEYSGAVLNGTGVGTLTADFCANQAAVLSVNSTLCGTGQALNYYKWTSPQATQQTYSIYVSYQLPAAFKQFQTDTTVQLTARTDNTTNGVVSYEMFKSEAGAVTACGTETTVTSTINTWQTVGINGNELSGCSFSSASANNFAIFKINVKANSNANVYVGTLSFTTTGQ